MLEVKAKPVTSLNFETTGSGKPVLALHGYGASPPRADRRYSLADHAAQIIDFIDEQKLAKFDLVGHSLGGGVALMIALDFAKRRPHSIGRLILVDSVALPQPLPWFMKVIRAPLVGAVLFSWFPERMIVRAISPTAYHNHRCITEEMIRAYSQNLATAGGRRAMIETARQIMPDDLPGLIARYHSLRLSTLLVWGRQDRSYRPRLESRSTL